MNIYTSFRKAKITFSAPLMNFPSHGRPEAVCSLVISSSFSPSHTWLLSFVVRLLFSSAVDERPKAGTMSNLCSVALNWLTNKLKRPILTLERDEWMQRQRRPAESSSAVGRGLISSGCSETDTETHQDRRDINGCSLLFHTQGSYGLLSQLVIKTLFLFQLYYLNFIYFYGL